MIELAEFDDLLNSPNPPTYSDPVGEATQKPCELRSKKPAKLLFLRCTLVANSQGEQPQVILVYTAFSTSECVMEEQCPLILRRS